MTSQNDLQARSCSLTIAQDTETEHEVLIPAEAADYLRISTKTLYRRIAKGEIRSRKVGGQHRLLKSDLDRWLKGDSE